MSDWLDELYQLHEADKQKQQEAVKPAVAPPPPVRSAADLLSQCEAHKLLRRAQEALLKGKGLIDLFEYNGKYERVIALVWQGPISAARMPDPNDPEDYQYIAVGVKEGQVYVNGQPLPAVTPEALKAALVEASRKPARQHPKRRGQQKKG